MITEVKLRLNQFSDGWPPSGEWWVLLYIPRGLCHWCVTVPRGYMSNLSEVSTWLLRHGKFGPIIVAGPRKYFIFQTKKKPDFPDFFKIMKLFSKLTCFLFQFWQIPIMTNSDSDKFQFWQIPILTNSNLFKKWRKTDSDKFRSPSHTAWQVLGLDYKLTNQLWVEVNDGPGQSDAHRAETMGSIKFLSLWRKQPLPSKQTT